MMKYPFILLLEHVIVKRSLILAYKILCKYDITIDSYIDGCLEKLKTK